MSFNLFLEKIKELNNTQELEKLCDTFNILNNFDIYEKNVTILNEFDNLIQKYTINKQVEKLLKIPQNEQHSPEWFAIRKTCFTASSDIGIITKQSYKHTKDDDIDHDHLMDILILKKNGIDIEKFTGNEATKWGNKYENIAAMIYQDITKKHVLEFGLLIHEKYPFIGASPDGISTCGTMLEIKCPPLRKITGNVPLYYWNQIQTQLQVCNLDKCDFIECKIEEGTYDEIKNHEGYKGVIYNDNGKYIYPCNISIDVNYQIIYLENKIENFKKENLIFWKLINYSLVSVLKDNEWFNKNINEIKKTWERVEYYKNNKKELKKLHEKVLEKIKYKDYYFSD